jgi:hypothetical protein
MTTITGSLKVCIRKRIHGHGEEGEYPKGTAAELRMKSQTAGRPPQRGRRGKTKKKSARPQPIISWDLYVNGELARSDLTEMEAFSYVAPTDKLAGPAP